MVIKMFSLYDSKAEVFGVPFFMNATGLAVRAFTDLVNDPKSAPSRYPSDFSLFELGSFDDSKALYSPLQAPLCLGVGSSFVKAITPEVLR